MQGDERIREILGEAKRLAREYRDLTGKPLGVTGEVAEYEAARILGLTLTPARQAGHDAIERSGGTARRLQIKGRCMLQGGRPGQRLGSINLEHEDWDAVLMVLLDERLDATEIYEADRRAVEAALAGRGRTDMAIRKFRSIGTARWRRETSTETRHNRGVNRDDKFSQPVDAIEIDRGSPPSALGMERDGPAAADPLTAARDTAPRPRRRSRPPLPDPRRR